MAQKKYTVEQIIVKLREVELLCNKGNTIAEAARQAGITEQTYYRWRKEYGGMGSMLQFRTES
jgi:transposase-like protein